MRVEDFPALNAALNATSAVLLVIAYVLIRRGNYQAHAWTVIGALVVSVAFLVCYLIYHYNVGHRSANLPPSLTRTIYYVILASHVILAMTALPVMVILTVVRAARRQWDKHRRIAQPTFWIWLYVSVTGVAVYVMLYHVFPKMMNS